MRRAIRRAAFLALGILLVLSLGVAGFAGYSVRRGFPQTSGAVYLPGLESSVEIFRDRFGIPQVYAATQHDLFFAQGYLHAQDRFWQMDFWRHIGSGRLGEMFGESQLETDRFLRTLGWNRIVRQELAEMDEDSLAMLTAYTEGVNAYLADHRGSALGLEYAVLPLVNPAYQPEPWQPAHTLTWAKAMAWDLRGNMDEEIERLVLLKSLSVEQLSDLYPAYPADHPVIVAGGEQVSASEAVELAWANGWQAAALPVSVHLLQGLQAQIEGLENLIGPSGLGIGSNSWVISGRLTSTGKPFLANDPHLSAQLPSIWYEIGLHCQPKGVDCPYEVTGFSFAGSPGIILGHNDRIAWGFTNAGPDVMDLFIEKVNPDNPNQYEVNGRWVDMQLVQETLQVAGREPVSLTVRYTRHGPLITDSYFAEDFGEQAGIGLPKPFAMALRWTALEPNFTFRAIWRFNRAQNWQEFRAAAAEFAVPAQNLVYADVAGNIGYQMPGNIPIRANGASGALPVPGWTDDNEWTSYIPFQELPAAYNPAKGYIVTANNAVVGPGYPHLITQDWDFGYRAQRLVDLIERAPGRVDSAYIQQMQGDNLNLNAATLAPVFGQLQLADQDLDRARALLVQWDGQQSMDSSQAALFEACWRHLLADTFQDDLPQDYWPSGSSRWFEVISHLAQQPDSPWWDNRSTPARENRDQIFAQALEEALIELQQALGQDPARWAWGDLHTLMLRNGAFGTDASPAFIRALFNRGPYRTAGGASIVNATSWDATQGYQVQTLPSMRMIVDLSNLADSLAIHTSGESGHPFHPNYVDMTDLWRQIAYHPQLWTRSQVEANAHALLQLFPQKPR
jgi:penicillin amidase